MGDHITQKFRALYVKAQDTLGRWTATQSRASALVVSAAMVIERLPELADVGSQSFHEIVFNAVKREVRTAILALIQREREGEMIDTKLVKDVVGIFVEMGGSRTSLEVYVVDFEEMLLSSTADFYRRRQHLSPVPPAGPAAPSSQAAPPPPRCPRPLLPMTRHP